MLVISSYYFHCICLKLMSMRLKYQIKIAKELKLLIYILITCLIGVVITYSIGAVYEKEQYEQFRREQASAEAQRPLDLYREEY